MIGSSKLEIVSLILLVVKDKTKLHDVILWFHSQNQNQNQNQNQKFFIAK